MIRYAIPLILLGSSAVAQDWSFRIDVSNGAIAEERSGSRQSEFSNTGPYFSAETFAVVPTGAVPPCSEIESFEIDLFFGWSEDTNAHVMTKIDDRRGSWVQEDPWLILTPDENGDILTDEGADLVFQDISCVSDTQLRLAMTVRANVEGDGSKTPVKLTATAIAPIYHIDQY